MVTKVNAVSVDTKGLVELTGFCRQRLSAIRKDPALAFPEASVIGRSLRWLVSDVMQWLEAMKRSNADLLRVLATKRIPQPTPELGRGTRPLIGQRSPKPLQADVEAGNRLALSTVLRPGQIRVGSMVETQDGALVMRYRLGVVRHSPEEPSRAAVAVPMSRMITFSPDVSPDMKAKRLAAFEGQSQGRPGVSIEPVPSKPVDDPHSLPIGVVPLAEAELVAMKAQYESGATLDALCKQYRMGKSRVSRLLREAGAAARKPGRPPRQRR